MLLTIERDRILARKRVSCLLANEFLIIECSNWILTPYLFWNLVRAMVTASVITGLTVDVRWELIVAVIICWVVESIKSRFKGKASCEFKTSKQKTTRWKKIESVCQDLPWKRETNAWAVFASVKVMYVEPGDQRYDSQAKTQGGPDIETRYINDLQSWCFFEACWFYRKAKIVFPLKQLLFYSNQLQKIRKKSDCFNMINSRKNRKIREKKKNVRL